MAEIDEALAADRAFFDALLGGDAGALEALLAGDFVLVDVMAGSEIPRADLIAAVGGGMLKFEAIEPAEVRAREFPGTAIVHGRTVMRGRFGEAPWEARSRYTHVYVRQEGRWRLASAQGTPIDEPAAG